MHKYALVVCGYSFKHGSIDRVHITNHLYLVTIVQYLLRMAVAIDFLLRWRKYLILLFTPIVLSPLPLIIQDQQSSCAYTILIMAVYWTTESCSLAVTSLLPLLLFPALGVVKAKEISPIYFKDTNALFISGMLLAIAVEHWNLHKRIALKILLFIGTQPRRLLLGFMCPTAFLSMWVSNTATTAMMVPIGIAVLDEIKQIRLSEKQTAGDAVTERTEDIELNPVNQTHVSKSNLVMENRSEGTTQAEELEGDRSFSNLCKATMFSIAYSANIGGTATLTGTGTNLVFSGQTEELFGEEGGIGFGTWFIYAFPEALVLLFLAWLWLQWMYLGINFKGIPKSVANLVTRRRTEGSKRYDSVRNVIQQQYDKLGPMTFAERGVTAHFVILALLWVTRNPKFVDGWSALFKDSYVSDATAGIAIAFSLFNFPSKKPQLFKCDSEEVEEGSKGRPFTALLEWKVVTKKFPWNIVLLLGAGFAMAKAAKDSGLSEWLGEQLASLQSIPEFAIMLILCTVLCLFTEVTSNVATASIFLPIMGALAVNIDVHPWYFMVPATLACSFAYMLPVATPPNAIVFSSGYVKVSDMVKAGVGMNIISIAVLILWLYIVGNPWFDFGKIPSWAQKISNATAASNKTRC